MTDEVAVEVPAHEAKNCPECCEGFGPCAEAAEGKEMP